MNKILLVLICLLMGLASTAVFADRGGVIFYSGFEKGINADYAAGSPAGKIVGGKPSFGDGKVGKAILSGDTNGYLAYSTDKNVIPERGTIEFWFNPVNWNGNDDKFHVFFETKGASSITIYKYFDISYSSAIFMVSPTPEPKFRPQALGNMTGAKAGEWHHIAVTWTQKEIRIYIDGKASRPENLWTRELVKLGASFAFGDRSWNARSGCETLLDELYIYNRPLTESEVAWAYTHGQNRIPGDDIQAGVANRVWAKVTKLPFKGKIHLDVTASGCSSFTGKAWIEPSGKTVPADIKMVEPGRGSADILVKDLPAGNYKVKAEAKDASGNLIGTYEESFISPGPAVWLGNSLGVLKSVPKPWTAMKSSLTADGAAIDCWGRKYTLNKLGFPSAMVSQNKSILAGPVRLIAKTNGQEVVWTPGSCNITENKDLDVKLAGTWQSSLGTLSWKGLTEFDGMMRYDLVLNPVSGANVSSMELRVPVEEKYATLYFTFIKARCTTGDCSRGATPQGTGVVYKKDWSPYWWLGNEDVGLAGFCTSDEAWDDGLRDGAFRIERNNGVVEAVWSFNATQRTLDKPWKFTFGLQATPVKPLTDARKWRSAPWEGKVAGEALGLSPDYWPVNPKYNNYFTIWTTPSYIKYFGFPETVNDAKFKKVIDDIHKRKMMACFYSLILGIAPDSPEGNYYRDEWRIDRTDSRTGGDMTGYSGVYGLSPTKEQIDFMVWKNYNFMKKFNLDGLYHDWTGFYPSANQNAGYGYVRDGVVRWEYPVFDLRELYKRVYFTMKQYGQETGKTTVSVLHMSSHMIVPLLAFSDVVLDGEDIKPKPGSDPEKNHYLDVLPLDLFRAEMMGQSYGINKAYLAETPAAYRTEFTTRNIVGLALIHDTAMYGLWMDNPTIAGIYNTLDKFDILNAEFYPYWNNSDMVSGQDKSVICSIYRKPGKGDTLIVVYNATKKPVTQDLKVNWSKLCGTSAPTVTDIETGQKVPVSESNLTITLKPGDFRLILVK